jgi:hypothetical protein
VQVMHQPYACMPLRDPYRFIARQIEGVLQVAGSQTFYFNLPTHYLAWAIALDPGVSYFLRDKPAVLDGYLMPTEWRRALAGAQKLGLVNIRGDHYALTPVGEAVKRLLPSSLTDWAETHKFAAGRGVGTSLVFHQPEAAAVLRLLLLQEPIVRLLIEGLSTFAAHQANFEELAIACDRLDHARAPIIFLKPEAAATLADSKGRIRWRDARGEDFRSTTFMQYKSILKHAGILAEQRLGGTTAKDYNPRLDLWILGSALAKPIAQYSDLLPSKTLRAAEPSTQKQRFEETTDS